MAGISRPDVPFVFEVDGGGIVVEIDDAVVTEDIEVIEGLVEPGLLGVTIDGTWEDEVAAEDRIVDEAFEGRRVCLGRSALGGGCDDAAEGVEGLFLEGVADRSGTAIGGTGGDSALAAGEAARRERDIVRGVGGGLAEGAGDADRAEKWLSLFLEGLSLYPLGYGRRATGVIGMPVGGVGALSIRIPGLNVC